MRRSTLLALISLIVSIVGVLIAIAAYFKNHTCGSEFDDYLYNEDDFYDDDYDFDCECGEKCTEANEFQNADIDFSATEAADSDKD